MNVTLFIGNLCKLFHLQHTVMETANIKGLTKHLCLCDMIINHYRPRSCCVIKRLKVDSPGRATLIAQVNAEQKALLVQTEAESVPSRK